MATALSGLSGLGGLVVLPPTGPVRYTNVTYTRSSVYSADPAQDLTYQNLNDGVSATGATTNSGVESWIIADLGSDLPVGRVRVGGGSLSGWGDIAAYLNNSKIQTATNAAPTTWQDRATVTGIVDTAGSEFSDFTFSPVTARYVRLLIANNWLATSEFGIFAG